MCWSKIAGWFKKPVPVTTIDKEVTLPPETVKLSIPHPEEPRSDVPGSIEEVKAKWKRDWHVPEDSDLEVTFGIDENLPYPAYTLGSMVFFNPYWINPGVMAHEIAHVAYGRLTTGGQLVAFTKDFDRALKSDPLVRLLDEQNSYMNVSLVEGHAEIYRYLGEEMPGYLKRYYPGLLK